MSVTEAHLNAKLEAAEARTDTKFTELMSEIRLMSANIMRMDKRFEEIDARFEKIDARFEKIDARFDKVDARFEKVEDAIDMLKEQIHDVRSVTISMKWNILGAGLALAGLIIGIFAYGIQILDIAQALFTAGLNAK